MLLLLCPVLSSTSLPKHVSLESVSADCFRTVGLSRPTSPGVANMNGPASNRLLEVPAAGNKGASEQKKDSGFSQAGLDAAVNKQHLQVPST